MLLLFWDFEEEDSASEAAAAVAASKYTRPFWPKSCQQMNKHINVMSFPFGSLVADRILCYKAFESCAVEKSHFFERYAYKERYTDKIK